MTSCSNPLALDEEELLQYILEDENLDEAHFSHLQECSLCQKHLVSYRDTYHLLLSAFYRVECPDAMQLSLYCENMLSSKEMRTIDQHVSICLLCADEVNIIRQAIDRFPITTGAENSLLAQLIKKFGHLLKAHLLPQPQAVVRQAGPSSSWPRYYEAQDINLSLHLSYTVQQQMMLIGIILGNDEEQVEDYNGATVELYQVKDEPSETQATETSEEQSLLTTTVDSQGQFSFAPLQEGSYVLLLHFEKADVVIDQIALA